MGADLSLAGSLLSYCPKQARRVSVPDAQDTVLRRREAKSSAR